MDEYYARKPEGDDDRRHWQTLDAHLRGVAERGAEFAQGQPWAGWVRAAGQWHDLGKYSHEFQRRLAGASTRADHSTAGAQLAVRLFGDKAGRQDIVGRILAYGIAGHHAGLPDGNSPDESCLRARLTRVVPALAGDADRHAAKPELSAQQLATLLGARKHERDFAYGLQFFTRMLFSCLVDADRLDAEACDSQDKAEARAAWPSLDVLLMRLQAHFGRLAERVKDRQGPVNRIRAQVLAECVAAAQQAPGLFSLTVPTGGGKTLSSLAFALHHALRYGLTRVIYVIPYTSIIEQNAKVFREALGEDAVVEHHCNVGIKEGETAQVSAAELATENWDAPVVVTTNVQFFESLYSDRPSRCRKLHNIMRSVVILDEAQMLPEALLLPCVAAIRELAARYGTSVVLCTATQPALSEKDGLTGGLDGVREIAASPHSLHVALRRTALEQLGPKTLAEVAALVRAQRQVLCVVNTKPRARDLYRLCADADALHLSAAMCPAHRAEVLDDVKRRLAHKAPCRVISTQIVEAGVDLDFPVVLRELAGLDSIAQAAGRCNREGTLQTPGRVLVFEPAEGLAQLFRQNAQATQTVARQSGKDLLGLEAVNAYFRELYWSKGPEALDRRQFLQRLTHGTGESLYFPFREVGAEFRLISDRSVSVFVPWCKEGRALGRQLPYAASSRMLLRKAQRFMVSVHEHTLDGLGRAGAVTPLLEGLYMLANEDIYRRDVGLDWANPYHRDVESNIV